jgi:hypothetical protein
MSRLGVLEKQRSVHSSWGDRHDPLFLLLSTMVSYSIVA